MSDRLRRNDGNVPDMDLKVFMNLMVVLIPMLLVSAEFAKVSVMDISLPEDTGTNPDTRDEKRSKEDNRLKLTAIITDSVLTLGAKGGFLPSIHYKEYHKYVTKDHNAELLLPFERGKKAFHPENGRELLASERQEILLYSCSKLGKVKNGFYTEYGELLVDENNKPLTGLKKGNQVYVMSHPRRIISVDNPDSFTSRPLCAYDELQARLSSIKERFQEASDADDIIIAAEDNVAYDKIVQIMDQVREAGFGNVMISKLRG